MDTPEIEAALLEAARKYTDEHLNNPTPSEYLLIHNAMLIAWEMGIRQSIAHMREHGIVIGGNNVH